MRAITLHAPSKVNLYLGVGAPRPDGYHEVSTVLQALDFGDTVRILPADELTVTTSVDLGIPERENLAFRAAQAFAAEFSVAPRVVIEIEKRVPAGAGLAGGSSDAAAVLFGLARLHGVDPLDPRCIDVARQLGADCVFFLSGGAALMTGRGDLLASSLPSAVAHVALVKPLASVPTAAAYAQFDRSPVPASGPQAVVEALKAGDVMRLAAALANNLTAASAQLVPEVLDALAWVGRQPGVLGAVMAGSGSGTFALCEDETSARVVAEGAHAHGWWSVATTTRAIGIEITDKNEGGRVKVDAVVLSGGEGAVIDPQVSVKGFVPVAGRPMVDWVIDALRGAETVAEIALVVPTEEHARGWSDKVDRLVVSDASFIDNAIAGAESFESGRHVLGATGDLPALTPDAIDDFVRQSLAAGAEFSYPLIRAEDMEAQFPGSERTYVKVAGGPVTGGNLVVCSADLLKRNHDIGQRLFETRKSPVAMARVIGIPFIFKYLSGRLRVADVENKMEQLLGAKCSAIYSSYASIGADVDKPIDVVVASRVLYDRSTGRNH